MVESEDRQIATFVATRCATVAFPPTAYRGTGSEGLLRDIVADVVEVASNLVHSNGKALVAAMHGWTGPTLRHHLGRACEIQRKLQIVKRYWPKGEIVARESYPSP